jgi:FtsZ-interacting cell division protein ZipA
MEAIWDTHRGLHRSKGLLMTITDGVIVAIVGLLGAVISGLLAARNAGKQVLAERERSKLEAETKRAELMTSVHAEATGAARNMYQELCAEQQKRIEQQHKDLSALAADVHALREQLTSAQVELGATRRELIITQEALRETRQELLDTRVLLAATKDELLSSREGQRKLELECVALRGRVKDLETELAIYKKTGG